MAETQAAGDTGRTVAAGAAGPGPASAAIARYEAELAATPRASQPYEHALVAHRLGVAYAEAGGGRPEDSLRRSLACFDTSLRLLDPRYHPVEHARVLTAAGAARRGLGDASGALVLFDRAITLAAARVSGDEAAAMANNVGLAALEVGDRTRAIERFGVAAASFDASSAEGRRGRAAALHNRGLAHAAGATEADLTMALLDHDEALLAVGFDEAPLHHGMVHHSRGVVAATLAAAAADPAEAATWRVVALEAFTAALDVFTWPDHAVHHGIASYNLGRAWAAPVVCDASDLRRALVRFEDAVTAFDPRNNAALWRQSYDALLAADSRLGDGHPGWSRTDHLVALLHDDAAGAPLLMRNRLTRWLAQPDAQCQRALVGFAASAARIGGPSGGGAIALLLTTAIELPVQAQSAVLDALLSARAAANGDGRAALDRLVDRAIGDALNGPQRVFVRDHLVAGGFERP